MRAAVWLRNLAKKFDISLLILPVSADSNSGISDELADLCHDVRVIKRSFAERIWFSLRSHFSRQHLPVEQLWLSRLLIQRVKRTYADIVFDRIVVHRFYLFPAIDHFLLDTSEQCPVVLDIDDIESITRERLANLCSQRGMRSEAQRFHREASFYRKEEQRRLPLFEKVVSCSDVDIQALNEIASVKSTAVVPNSVRSREKRNRAAQQPFRFLFVGNYNYLPNQDAVDYLVKEILPYLRRTTDRAFQIVLVGSGRISSRADIARHSEITILGEVESVLPCYQEADAVVAPLRAGGGTRIKVIEAFAYHCPVVATSCGVEGLSVTHEQEVLLADDPKNFAKECARLIENPHLGAALAESAHRLYTSQYSERAVNALFSKLFS